MFLTQPGPSHGVRCGAERSSGGVDLTTLKGGAQRVTGTAQATCEPTEQTASGAALETDAAQGQLARTGRPPAGSLVSLSPRWMGGTGLHLFVVEGSIPRELGERVRGT